MDNKALNNAEITLFYEKIKYRDATGAEREAMQLRPYGTVKFDEKGQEGGYVTRIIVSYDGAPADETQGHNGQTGLRVFLEPAPIEDESKWMHQFGEF